MRKSSKLLTNELPLILLPTLGKKLGSRSAAIVLQQIHYWTQNPKCGRVIDGVRWIYNTYLQWTEQLLLSISTIKRAIALLKNLGLILVEQHDKSEWNHRNYYRIDYKALKALQLSIGSECTDESSQTETPTKTNLHQSSIDPENTSENTTHTEVCVENSFPQETGSEIIEKHEARLKTYGIYKESWSGDKLVQNPKLKPVLQELAKVPADRAERSIFAFIDWFKRQDATKVKDKYKALANAIRNDWELAQ